MKSFRRNGKVAKLNAVEAGYLCDVPLKTLVSLMLLEMQRRGIVRVLQQDPLQIEQTGSPTEDLTRYHRFLLDNLDGDGRYGGHVPGELIRAITRGIQEKAWDCDLEATRNHYHKEFARQFRRARAEATAFWEGADEPTETDRTRTYYPYYHHFSPLLLAHEVVLGLRMKLRPEALIFGFGQLLKGWTVMDRLSEIKVPTLVMAGRDDFQFPPEHQAALAAGIANARLEIIERAGHNAQSERPAEVMEAVKGFIVAVAPTSRSERAQK